jgi:hypothetical protein
VAGSRRAVVGLAAGLLAMSTGVVLGVASTGSAGSVAPTSVAGNPACSDYGYDELESTKLDPNPGNGTFALDGSATVTIAANDGSSFSWSSTVGIDVVIVKGGQQGANVYVYDPPTEAFADTGLVTPDNPNEEAAGISHLEFCYDWELAVTKTADTSFTRTFDWDIVKTATPETWDLFEGDSGTSQYSVAVTKTGHVDSEWAASGTVSVHNPSPLPATVTAVSDEISGIGGVAVDCGIGFPVQVAAGGTLSCSYAIALPDGSNRTNTATASTSGAVSGDSGTADVEFGEPTNVVNGSIDVDDTNGTTWQFGASGSVTYSRTFTCDADEGVHDNTATIRQTGESDGASVVVDCHDLAVTKDASTALVRTWEWTIEKDATNIPTVGDLPELFLAIGQSFTIDYEVTVGAVSTDSSWAVDGDIAVVNPSPIAATINSVADVVSPDVAATVDCGVTFPYVLSPGGTLDCWYESALGDASERLNTATATLQNHSYDAQGTPTPTDTTPYAGTAAVSFAHAAVREADRCVDVSDTYAGELGSVCADESPATRTLTYSRTVSFDECAEYLIENTATFVAHDSGATGSVSVDIPVYIACEGAGCTLTPGYWKTHSELGPAPYDDTWGELANGASTPFSSSGGSWYEVLWTPPRGGNAYYILAHAFIAAELNALNGASTTLAVDVALAFADEFFTTYQPTSKLPKTTRAEVVAMAAVLDAYNNGLVGPGHCSEDASSAP